MSTTTTTTATTTFLPPGPTLAPSNEHAITSPQALQDLLSADLARVSLLNFWAAWAEPCAQMNAVVRELAARYPRLLVLDVEADAEEVADVAESFEVVSVPTFVVLRVSLFYPAFLFRTLCVCAWKMTSFSFLCFGPCYFDLHHSDFGEWVGPHAPLADRRRRRRPAHGGHREARTRPAHRAIQDRPRARRAVGEGVRRCPDGGCRCGGDAGAAGGAAAGADGDGPGGAVHEGRAGRAPLWVLAEDGAAPPGAGS